MIALAIALLLMQQPYSTYWNDEPVALPSTAAWEGGPLDVPAVRVMKSRASHGGCFYDGKKTWHFTPGSEPTSPVAYPCSWKETVTRWSCADKSRVLLTSENGTRHCLKF